jgi:hypothetical protein
MFEGRCEYLRQCGVGRSGYRKFCQLLRKLESFMQTAAQVILRNKKNRKLQGLQLREEERVEQLHLAY